MARGLTWEEAQKGGKSVSLRDVEAMLREYGFEYHSDKRVNWIHPQYSDLRVSIDDTRREVDTKAVKAAGSACEQVEERRAVPVTQPSLNGSAKLPDWLQLRPGYSGEMHGSELTVRSNEYPELQMHLTLKEGDRNPAAAYVRAFEAFQQTLDMHSKIVADLKANYGFEFNRNNGELIVTQKDYGLEFRFATNGSVDFLTELPKIEGAAEEKYLQWAEKLDALQSQGAQIQKHPGTGTNGDVPTDIIHPQLKEPVRIILHGGLDRIDRDGLVKIEAALAELSAIKEAPAVVAKPVIEEQPNIEEQPKVEEVKPAAAPVIKQRTIADYVAKPKPKLPNEQKSALVLDTPILAELASPRGNGRTWLDLLPIAADSPTVDKIYIPASVADWELMGGVSYLQPGNNDVGFQPINRNVNTPGHKRNRGIDALRELLSTATQSRLDENGIRHIVPGKNPNIVIYETELDKKFLDGAYAIYHDRSIPFTQKWDKYNELNARVRRETFEAEKQNNPSRREGSIEGDYGYLATHDLGELSAEQIASSIKGMPAVLITHDTSYLRNRDELHTVDGFPITEATPRGFIPALFSQMQTQVHKELGEYGGDVGELTLEKYIQDVEAAGHFEEFNGRRYPNSHPPCKPGAYMTAEGERGGETLESLFKRGAAIERGESPEFNMLLPDKIDSRVAEESVVREPEPQREVVADIPPVVPAAVVTAAAIAPAVVAATIEKEEKPEPVAEEKQQPVVLAPPADEIIAPVAAATPVIQDKQPEPPCIVAEEKQPKDEKDMELPFEETLGYKIGFHRIQRKMTEDDLATEVRKIAQYRPDVDGDAVFRWQSNQELPQGEIYEALVRVLVDDNDKVEDKAKVKEEFRDAYQRTKKALEQGASAYTNPDDYRKDTFAFVNTLRQYRRQAGLMDDDELAEKVLHQVKFDIGERLDEIDAMLMFKMSANAHRPSLGLLRATVKALHEKLELAPEEKQEIFDACSLGKSNAVRTITEGRGSLAALDDRLADMKRQMSALFVKDGEELSGAQIARMTTISQSEVSQVIGLKSRPPTQMSEEKLRKHGTKMSEALKTITGDDTKVADFNRLFEEFANLVREEKRRKSGRE